MLSRTTKFYINARGIHRGAQHFIKICPIRYSNAPDFGYSNEKQQSWAKLYPAWNRQYPIVIYSGAVEVMGMAPLKLEGYDKIVPGRLAIGNNGHTVSISLIQDNKNRQCNSCSPPTISGGLLKNIYEFEGLHFHWTKKNNRGCEHVIDNMRYPLEMHLVHRNIKYNSIENALEHEDGLCVAAIFFNISEMPYKPFNTIIDNFIYIQNTNTNMTLDYGLILDSFLPTNTQSFYTYKGSLLSPPYNKSINWIIFTQPIYISYDQLSAFQLLQKNQDNEIFDNCNCRNIQLIENKKVYARNPNIPFIPACNVSCPNMPITSNANLSCPNIPTTAYNEMYFPIPPSNNEYESNRSVMHNFTNKELIHPHLVNKEYNNLTATYNQMCFPISTKHENESNKKTDKKVLEPTPTNNKNEEHSSIETCNEMYAPSSPKHEINESNKKTNIKEVIEPTKEEHNSMQMYIPISHKNESESNKKMKSNTTSTRKEVIAPTVTKKEVHSATKKEYCNPIATNVISTKTQDRGLLAGVRNMIKDTLIKFFSK